MWHPVHGDLFAVSYGSFDWVRQGAGGVAVFTLKNTSAPLEYFPTDCGDHPHHTPTFPQPPSHHVRVQLLLDLGLHHQTIRSCT